MDKLYCKICNEELVSGHTWKEHRIKEADYFQLHYPRRSKETGELIQFKSREFYLNSDFNDKREMIKWFKNNPLERATYARELLAQRIKNKKLEYAPSQVELRSLMMPSVVWFKEHLGNYADTCKMVSDSLKVELKIRFDREDDILSFGEAGQHDKIIIDTREQMPLRFDVATETAKLEYGDYALSPNKYKVHIERKNLSDFVGTFGVGFERFCREIERAKKDRAYLIVLVESSITDALRFNYLPQTKYCKVSPDFIFHNVRATIQKYGNIQFLFCNGRREAAKLVKQIFTIKRHPKHYDLQYYKDAKKL